MAKVRITLDLESDELEFAHRIVEERKKTDTSYSRNRYFSELIRKEMKGEIEMRGSNAKEALQYWEDGIFDYENAPKWVKGVVEMFFNTDSVHLYHDDHRQKELVNMLEQIAEGKFTPEFRVDEKILRYLKNEVHSHECKQCGTDYESFDKTASFCTMRCLNAYHA